MSNSPKLISVRVSAGRNLPVSISKGETQSIEESNSIESIFWARRRKIDYALLSWAPGTGRQLKLMTADGVSASSKMCVRDATLDDRIIFWLVFMAIICFVILSTLIMLFRATERNFRTFFLAFWASQMFWIIFHSRRPRQLHPALLFIPARLSFEVALWLSLTTLVYNFIGQCFRISEKLQLFSAVELNIESHELFVSDLCNECWEIRKSRDNYLRKSHKQQLASLLDSSRTGSRIFSPWRLRPVFEQCRPRCRGSEKNKSPA